MATAPALNISESPAASISLLSGLRPVPASARGARSGRPRCECETASAIACSTAPAATAGHAAGTPHTKKIAWAAIYLLSIGLVYRIPGQLSWLGAAVFTPLTAGAAFGAVAMHAGLERAASGGLPPIALLAAIADATVFAFRAGVFKPGSARRPGLSLARFLLLDVLPSNLLFLGAAPVAVAVAAAGVALDRWLFYAGGIQHTTEVEVARVEAAIEAASQHEP